MALTNQLYGLKFKYFKVIYAKLIKPFTTLGWLFPNSGRTEKSHSSVYKQTIGVKCPSNAWLVVRSAWDIIVYLLIPF